VRGNSAKSIPAYGEYTGGFIGAAYSANITILNSSSSGNVNGTEETSGMVGLL